MLAAAPGLCRVECMAATNEQFMQSSVKQSMNGFNCTKLKAGRFPDRHLSAKSKRLSKPTFATARLSRRSDVAIDRFTGQVLDKQIEVVNE